MTRRPLAQVRVLKLPHLHPDALRIEVECPVGVTGLTHVPGGAIDLDVLMLTTMAIYEHEARCGECSTEEVHWEGDQQVRAMTDRAWAAHQQAQVRRYVHGRRN